MHSNRTVTSAPARYIPFNDFHIAPLSDVTPEAVKRAAKVTRTTYRDREVLKQTIALNFISQRLGFTGGFAGYKREYEASSLLSFMRGHGLEGRQDLINGTVLGFDLISLKPRQVSDRLFLQPGPLPRRIFTGYDVDWFELNNRYFHDNPWRKQPDFDEFCVPFGSVMGEVAAAGGESTELGRQLLEAAVVACDYSVRSGSGNLVGD